MDDILTQSWSTIVKYLPFLVGFNAFSWLWRHRPPNRNEKWESGFCSIALQTAVHQGQRPEEAAKACCLDNQFAAVRVDWTVCNCICIFTCLLPCKLNRVFFVFISPCVKNRFFTLDFRLNADLSYKLLKMINCVYESAYYHGLSCGQYSNTANLSFFAFFMSFSGRVLCLVLNFGVCDVWF